MSYPSTIEYNLTVNELIRSSFRLLAIDEIDAYGYTNGFIALNLMLKSWQNEHVGIWLNSNLTLYLNTTSQYYLLGSAATDAPISSSVDETQIATAAVTGATSIVVDSITGIAASDKIGIELDDGTLQWTTVSGSPSGTTIVLAAALTDDVAVDNYVYTYTTRANRPLEILEARLRDDDDMDMPLNIVSRREYMGLSTKDDTGTPNTVYYDAQLTSGRLYVYPVNDNVTNRIILTAKMPIYDIDTATDNVYVPVEWLEAVKYNLAVRLIPENINKIINKSAIPLIISMAQDLKDKAISADSTLTSIFFLPDIRR